MDFDLILLDGSVIDGSGSAPVRSDVGLRDGRVAAIGNLDRASSAESLDVSGLLCSPGFIDTHTHSDLAAFLPADSDNVRLASVRQGVTTEVCGNCGFSPFPVLGSAAGAVQRHLGVLFGGTAETFESLEEFAGAVERAGLVNNLVPLVGHGTLRSAVVGFEARPATVSELEEMARLLDLALSDGAVGLSSGLVYPPAVYAPTAELAYLVGVVAKHGRIYATHMRDEMDLVEEAVDEALTVARGARVPVHLSHLKSAGPANFGRIQRVLETLDAARAAGGDVTADMYPYTAGSTVLHSLLPVWVSEGGTDEMLGRLADSEIRRRLTDDIATGRPGWQNLVGGIGWDNVSVASAPRHPDSEGRTITELAASAATRPMDYVADLLIAEEGAVTIIMRTMTEPDVRDTLSWQHTMLGSDAIPIPGKPHPRGGGSFVRMLGKWSRDEQLMPLAETIRKVTSLPADRFGLHDRGRLVEGAIADIVVLDPDDVLDRATYENPLTPPQGIHRVLVGGVAVIADGQPTGATPGKVIRAG